MKVLIVTERFFPEVGAAPSRLTNMAQGLVEKGIEVDVLTSLPNYPKGEIYEGYKGKVYCKENAHGCAVYRYWTYATVSKSPIKRALNMLVFSMILWLFSFKFRKCRGYDEVIIQTPSLFVATSSMFLFKKLYRKKCILNVSDIWPSTAVDMGAMKEGSKAYKVMSWCERFLYRNSDGILGQSGEILSHISNFKSTDKVFLYRNLQRYDLATPRLAAHRPFKVVYAGLLGYAQDILSIIQNVDFNKLGVEFHVIGGGGQFEAISQYVESNQCSNVYIHGSVPKEKMPEQYAKYDAAIVPLAVSIYGAFPSKIYDVLPFGLPILFCGSGEGADFVLKNHVGYVANPGDYASLSENISKLSRMSDSEYALLSANCLEVVTKELDFNSQMDRLVNFIELR